MRLKERRLRNSSLYLILDKGSLKSRDPVKTAKRVLGSGVDIVQLRDKLSCDREITEYGKRLKRLTNSKAALLIVNDRIDICQALDADGVHLGQADISLNTARSILGRKKIIGITCCSLDDAVKAEKGGADYIAVGPIFRSPTKPKLKSKGLRFLKAVNKKVKVPVVAIGGINKTKVGKVMECKTDMIAVASAVLRKRDIRKAVIDLRKEMSKLGSREWRE